MSKTIKISNKKVLFWKDDAEKDWVKIGEKDMDLIPSEGNNVLMDGSRYSVWNTCWYIDKEISVEIFLKKF